MSAPTYVVVFAALTVFVYYAYKYRWFMDVEEQDEVVSDYTDRMKQINSLRAQQQNQSHISNMTGIVALDNMQDVKARAAVKRVLKPQHDVLECNDHTFRKCNKWKEERDIVSEDDGKRQLDLDMLPENIRVAVYGKTMSGKTSWVMELMKHHCAKDFDSERGWQEVHVFTGRGVGSDFRAVMPDLFIYDGFKPAVIEELMARRSERVMRGEDVQSMVIVFDDVLGEDERLEYNSTIMKLLSTGRHNKISTILILHHPVIFPKMRSQIDLSVILSITEEALIERFANLFLFGMKKEEATRLFFTLRDKPFHGFAVVNTPDKILVRQVRVKKVKRGSFICGSRQQWLLADHRLRIKEQSEVERLREERQQIISENIKDVIVHNKDE